MIDGAAPPMTDEDFRLLRELVHESFGLVFADDRRAWFEKRLAPRLVFRDLPSFAALQRFLRFDPARRAELEAVAEALTNNETYFFREPLQLRAFAEEILPSLAAWRAPERRLRVWSAGCSTGEEAYTLAALLLGSGRFEGWRIEVLGTDLARRALAVARRGTYGASSFRSPEAEAIRPWFREGGGRWTVADELRQAVSFGYLNLVDERASHFVGPVDAVFCRNVMIYFDEPVRRRVVKMLHGRLRAGGWLLLGHSESLLHVTTDFELVQLRHDLVYRKPLDHLHGARSRTEEGA